MGTEVAISFSTLRTQLENEKSSLCKIDESIKRIVQTPGRYSNDRYNNSSGDYGRNGPRERGRNPFPDSINHFKDNEQLGKRKQETKTVFSRISARVQDSDGEGDEPIGVKKPRVSSAVWRELPTRADIVRAQGQDEQSRVRNRRMFGSLLGTLQKFRQEEIVLQTKEEKKAQVERKIEEQARLEKEREQRERKSLFIEREQKKATIKALEAKMFRVSEFEKWESSQKSLGNFILTKAKPHIYWIPKKINDKTSELLSSSKKYHEKILAKKHQELQEELQRIEHRCFRPRVPAAKENEPQSNQMDTDEQSTERQASHSKSDHSPQKQTDSEKYEVDDSNKSKRDKFAMDVDKDGEESDADDQHDEDKIDNKKEQATALKDNEVSERHEETIDEPSATHTQTDTDTNTNGESTIVVTAITVINSVEVGDEAVTHEDTKTDETT